MLSVVIITLNEEAKIRDCLESVKWADEIIVADNSSQDRTVDIAKEYTHKVYKHTLLADLAKNFAIEKATGDWILSIDADERITPELRVEIQETLKSPQCDGYYIPRKSYFLGKWIKHCGWWPDYVLRLIKKDKGRYENRANHAKVLLQGITDKLKNPLLHLTLDDLTEYLNTTNRDSDNVVAEATADTGQVSVLTSFLHSWAKFFSIYIIKRGFLDGKEGLILSVLLSYSALIKYLKLWQKWNKAV